MLAPLLFIKEGGEDIVHALKKLGDKHEQGTGSGSCRWIISITFLSIKIEEREFSF